MGLAVKTHAAYTPAHQVLDAGVRVCWDAGSAIRRGMAGALLGPRVTAGKTVTAAAFSARRREPSFYQGLSIGPSLRSALQGRIAYPWGLGPGGPAQ